MAGKFDWTRLSAWVILLSGLTLSATAYHYVSAQLRSEAQAKFEHQSREIHRAISSRLTSYTGLLWGLRGLYQASDGVTRREFRDYVHGLELASRYPAILSINFAEQVNAPGKAAFERRLRNDRSLEPKGYPEFRIRPPGERSQYQVLTLLEPFEPRVFGADMERLSKPRFDEVRRSGDFVSSGELVPHQPGLPLALRLAVYKKGLPANIPEERNKAFLGSVGMGFSLLRLMRDAVSPEVMSQIRIRIYNIGRNRNADGPASPAVRSLLIDTAGMADSMSVPANQLADAGDHLTVMTRLDFGGALLELSFDSRVEPFAAPQSRFFPAAVLAAGLTASLLLALMVALLQRSKRRLEQAVSDRTAALQSTNHTLEEEINERNRLEREVIRGLVDERRRYGQELHDNLGQQLTAAGFLVETLGADLKDLDHGCALQAKAIQSHIFAVMTQTRELAKQLNPVAEKTGGLCNALQELASHAKSASGVGCSFRIEGEVQSEDAALEHNLFRMAQQAVSDAINRHARNVDVELGNDVSGLMLRVIDNGDEMDASSEYGSSGMGMRFIRYRCSVLGLILKISSSVEGTTVMVKKP